ncbi:NUDIX domain-containing protein [Sphingobium mellinum]|uniref:NUDIX domain-containing protein n=1 Tax=Sphingobium mellinum TaxID=1387166 RepID=UPI0030EBE1CB
MNRLSFIRPAMKAADRVRRFLWRLRRKAIHGVMALAYTPAGRLVLVRQTYMDGWCLPGGGRQPKEDPVEAALRELRQEIGLVSWTEATRLGTVERQLSGAPAHIDLVRVKDVVFQFRKNWETEEVGLFDRKDLPNDLNSWSLEFISAAQRLE